MAEFLGQYWYSDFSGKTIELADQGSRSFHAEKEAAYDTGLRNGIYQQTDDTQTRVNEQNQHCHVMCNSYYTAYFTRAGKDCLTVLDMLRQGRKREFMLNVEALAYLHELPLSKATWQILQDWRSETVVGEDVFLKELDMCLPGLNQQQRNTILSAMAVSVDHAERGVSIVQILVCDDAPQFKRLTCWLALCWGHEVPHYKKLALLVSYHQILLKDSLTRFWMFYGQPLTYRQYPNHRKRYDWKQSLKPCSVLTAGTMSWASASQKLVQTKTHSCWY